MKEKRNERNERTKNRKNEGTKERKNEGTKELHLWGSISGITSWNREPWLKQGRPRRHVPIQGRITGCHDRIFIGNLRDLVSRLIVDPTSPCFVFNLGCGINDEDG